LTNVRSVFLLFTMSSNHHRGRVNEVTLTDPMFPLSFWMSVVKNS